MQGTNILPIFAPDKQSATHCSSSGGGQGGAKKKENMNIENAKSQMRKGMLEYCVLLLLNHRPSYASDIIQQLKQAELLVVEGTLYPLLTRLKNDGLLRYEWQESTQGPPRKYYALSPVGEQFLEGLDTAWTELSNTINYLKNIKDLTLNFN